MAKKKNDAQIKFAAGTYTDQIMEELCKNAKEKTGVEVDEKQRETTRSLVGLVVLAVLMDLNERRMLK